MKKPNDLMTLKGFDHKGGKRNLIQEQPFSNTDEKHYGMPITACASLEMIRRFQDQIGTNPEDPFNNVYWVEFSKASIFRVLSYENCEYIRFYLAIPDKDGKDASMSLQCVDATGEVIKKEQLLQVAARMQAQRAVKPYQELDEDTIYREMDHRLPPIEEKGNGGVTFLNADNVKSIKDFIERKGTELTQMDFEKFTASFYEYVKEKF